MVQTPARKISLTDFLQQPETKPASEYINGQTYQKPMPQGEHSTLQLDLGAFVNTALKPTKIGRAYTELRCTFGERSLVPDISIFRWERIPREPNGRVSNRFELPPDWIIEILSPGQSQTKVMRNILHCLDHGTEMGWMIDPEESCVVIYQPNQIPQLLDQVTATLPVPSFATAVELTIEHLFSWLID